MGTQIRFVDGKILFVDGKIAFDAACCCEPVECETLCTEPLPDIFDVDIDHDAFNRLVTGCDYDTGTFESPYGGAFECQFLGSVNGVCRWYYCGDDPCNPGQKFVVSPYAVGTIVGVTIFYGVNELTCEPEEIIAAIEATDYAGFDDFNEPDYGTMDCCTIDGDFLQWKTAAGFSHVTLTDKGLTITGRC